MKKVLLSNDILELTHYVFYLSVILSLCGAYDCVQRILSNLSLDTSYCDEFLNRVYLNSMLEKVRIRRSQMRRIQQNVLRGFA